MRNLGNEKRIGFTIGYKICFKRLKILIELKFKLYPFQFPIENSAEIKVF